MTKQILIYLSGLSFAIFFFWHYSLALVALLMQMTLSKWLIYGAVCLTFATIYLILWHITKHGYMALFAVIPTALLILGLSYGIVVNHELYDTSFDGQSYQGEAAVSLINGWNPLQQPQVEQNNQFVEWSANTPWLNTHPKAAWYLTASAYDLTGHYTDIKFFHFSILLGVFLVVYAVLLSITFSSNRGIQEAIRLGLSAFITLNPIAVVQSTTLNLDGLLYSFLIMLLANVFFLYRSYEDSKLPKTLYYFLLTLLIIVIVNVKTAGLVYALLFTVAFAVYQLFFKYRHVWTYFTTVIISFVLAVGVFGYNPYLTHKIFHGNILHHAYVQDNNAFKENIPSNYRNKSNIEVFLHSLFFVTDDTFKDGEGEPAQLKLPFVIHSNEIDSLANPELKKGGFGPLFSGTLIVVLFGFIFAAGSQFKEMVEHNPYTNKSQGAFILRSLLVTISIGILFFVSFTLTATSNTARYVPHVWLLLGIFLTYIFYTRFQIARFIATIALLIGFINIALVSFVYFSTQISDSNTIEKNITNMVYSGDSYRVNFGYHTSTRQLFLEHQIPFTAQSEDLNCFNPQDISGIYINNTTGTCIINQ